VVVGLTLAKQLKCKVTAVTVSEPWRVLVTGEIAVGFPINEYEQATAETASRVLAAVMELARKSDVACATVHVKDQDPAEAILDTAKKAGCDLIVMASHGRRDRPGADLPLTAGLAMSTC
jgi:nucleotide-binding universal stress UspA family protein